MSADSEKEDRVGPTITFGPSTVETVLTELGFQVGDSAIVVDEAGTPVEPAFGEAPITVDEVAGFVTNDDGTVSVIRDDFTSLVEYVNQFDADGAAPSDSDTQNTGVKGGGFDA